MKKRLGLAEHGRFQEIVELGVELLVGLGEIDLAQFEPLAGKVLA